MPISPGEQWQGSAAHVIAIQRLLACGAQTGKGGWINLRHRTVKHPLNSLYIKICIHDNSTGLNSTSGIANSSTRHPCCALHVGFHRYNFRADSTHGLYGLAHVVFLPTRGVYA